MDVDVSTVAVWISTMSRGGWMVPDKREESQVIPNPLVPKEMAGKALNQRNVYFSQATPSLSLSIF